jgi:hypothetical protein
MRNKKYSNLGKEGGGGISKKMKEEAVSKKKHRTEG